MTNFLNKRYDIVSYGLQPFSILGAEIIGIFARRISDKASKPGAVTHPKSNFPFFISFKMEKGYFLSHTIYSSTSRFPAKSSLLTTFPTTVILASGQVFLTARNIGVV